MSFVIGLLTFILVLICIALVLLVLIQLPKKEAGIGVAFGGGATDALFGAGSGTVLTKATKYAATAFFVLAVIVGMMQSRLNKQRTSEFQRAVEQQSSQPAHTPAGQSGSSAPTTPPSVATPLVPEPAATPPSTSTN
jgi:preprotein translocase subunit SecG